MNAVNIFTVKELVTLYKGDDAAERIELLRFEEVGYEVVVGKDNHKVGDSVVFILPDYCVSDIQLFQSFIAPNGQTSKSYLGLIEGQPRRIRAKKFNFHTGDGKGVYSNGIILSIPEVNDVLEIDINNIKVKLDYNEDEVSEYLTKKLKITKYETPEPRGSGPNIGQERKGGFPIGVYKTDEININNVWNRINFPITLVGTEKIDGSSISIGITDQYPDGFITSRNLNKSFTDKIHNGRRKKTLLEKILFWTKPDLNLYKEIPSQDEFVIQGMPYLNKMKEAGLTDVILRGELNGKSYKGSGNKNNPANKVENNIRFFYADTFCAGFARKKTHKEFKDLCNLLNLYRVPELFETTFKSKEELKELVEKYFKYAKDNNRSIEGIVLATPENRFSCKYMNDEYDSKK